MRYFLKIAVLALLTGMVASVGFADVGLPDAETKVAPGRLSDENLVTNNTLVVGDLIRSSGVAIEITDFLGKGSYGAVYSGKVITAKSSELRKLIGKEVAVKQLFSRRTIVGSNGSADAKDVILRNNAGFVFASRLNSHKMRIDVQTYIVDKFHWGNAVSDDLIVMEKADGDGHMLDAIINLRRGEPNHDRLLTFFEFAEYMQELVENSHQGFHDLDLKKENLLVIGGKVVRGDKDFQGQNEFPIFSYGTAGPEVFTAYYNGEHINPRDYAEKSNMYALGMLLFEVLFGVKPDSVYFKSTGITDELRAQSKILTAIGYRRFLEEKYQQFYRSSDFWEVLESEVVGKWRSELEQSRRPDELASFDAAVNHIRALLRFDTETRRYLPLPLETRTKTLEEQLYKSALQQCSMANEPTVYARPEDVMTR